MKASRSRQGLSGETTTKTNIENERRMNGKDQL